MHAQVLVLRKQDQGSMGVIGPITMRIMGYTFIFNEELLHWAVVFSLKNWFLGWEDIEAKETAVFFLNVSSC